METHTTDDQLKPKTPSQSAITTRYLLMPGNANAEGVAFGGVILAWIDMVAAMAAQQHAGREVVTGGIDSISFLNPVHIGDHVVLKASVNYVGRTSMEVGVRVSCQCPYTNKEVIATTAYLTMVALDKNQKPCRIPPIDPRSEQEKRRFENAKIRVKTRKELRTKIKK